MDVREEPRQLTEARALKSLPLPSPQPQALGGSMFVISWDVAISKT